MDDQIKQLIYDAQAITRGLNETQGTNADEAVEVRLGIIRWAGIADEDITEDTWDDLIETVPVEIRKAMIDFDDALNFVDTTSLMFNLWT